MSIDNGGSAVNTSSIAYSVNVRSGSRSQRGEGEYVFGGRSRLQVVVGEINWRLWDTLTPHGDNDNSNDQQDRNEDSGKPSSPLSNLCGWSLRVRQQRCTRRHLFRWKSKIHEDEIDIYG